MQKFLPLFPLKLIVFPGEQINLHIFEPRYKQLIKDCQLQGKTFGIPPYIGDRITEYGTELELVSIEKEYENGELDIKAKGKGVIRILEFLKEVPEKLYSAGIISLVEEKNPRTSLKPQVVEIVKEYHQLIGIAGSVFKEYDDLLSFDVGHYIGMRLEDQYELLSCAKEDLRQNIIYHHLKKVVPIVAEAQRVREKVKANGHFRREIPPQL